MADTEARNLTALAGTDLASNDKFPVSDVSVPALKNITRDELQIALAGTPAVALGAAAAAGTATTLVRTDATIVAFDTTVPTTSAIADVAAVGTAAVAARRDHVHGREDLDQSNCAPASAETIAANYSAIVVGPYTIAVGVLVTISSGGVLAIL